MGRTTILQMFWRGRPSAGQIAAFLAESRGLPLSYDPASISNDHRAGFTVDVALVGLGSGDDVFAQAKAALAAWKHFELGWVELFPESASSEPGTTVAVLVRHLGFWSLNGCRVVSAIRGPDQRFGFAYGTLTNHAEAGEESFTVSVCPETGGVRYGIRAVSRPRARLARLGFPITRALQARFRRDSGRAMQRAIRAL